MKLIRTSVFFSLFALAIASLSLSQVQAGVFNLPRFINQGEFAIGIEPEFLMSGTAAVGVNLRYTHGLSDLNNLIGIMGTGGGDRQFRFGGALTSDFFPDVDRQPGIGLAVQGLFVQGPVANSVELTGIPYIHKSFKVHQEDVDPFVAVPLGIAFIQGNYRSLASLVLGALFKHSDHLSSIAEFGIGLSTASTYFSGGLVYYH